ncbi:MAG TPA: SulP family inorganic anion transporter, partial [Candidatus Limnocylindrales bacterium]
MTAETPTVGGAGAGGRALSHWLPIADWLPAYRPEWLRFDAIAAITSWALIVPQAIAYAQIAGLPPPAGLAAAAAGLLAYGLLGTSKQLLVSPTSSTAAISAALVGTVAAGDAAQVGHLSSALAILVGLTFVILGLARIGFVSRFIPTAVQVGFMFGLGLTILTGQLTKILGIGGVSGSFVDEARGLLGELGGISWVTALVGVLALAALILGRRLVPNLPMALIVVVVSIVTVTILDLAARGVAVIGDVQAGFPLPALPLVGAQDFLALVPGAVAISMIGSAESLTVAQQFADEHRDEIRADQELIANGGANVLSGLFQGFIVGGGASQSAANDHAGARTPVASILVAALTAVTAVALLPLFRNLPDAVLGAIVISAVLGFLRLDELRRIATLRRDSFVLALVALVATLLLGILPGLIVAVILSLLLLLVRLARPTTTEVGRRPDGTMGVMGDADAAPIPGLLFIRLDAPLLFLNAALLRDQVRAQIRAAETPPQVVIVDLEASSELDVESLDLLRRIAEQARENGAELWLADVRPGVAEMLGRAGIDPETGAPRWFRRSRDAIAA